jgi:hypothetical protein
LTIAGILKAGEQTSPESKSILKSAVASEQAEVRSILKADTEPQSYTGEEDYRRALRAGGILKKDSPTHDKQQEPRGILKRESSFENKPLPEKGVLKKQSSFETDKGTVRDGQAESAKDIRGILRDSANNNNNIAGTDPQGILKSMPAALDTQLSITSITSNVSSTIDCASDQDLSSPTIDDDVFLLNKAILLELQQPPAAAPAAAPTKVETPVRIGRLGRPRSLGADILPQEPVPQVLPVQDSSTEDSSTESMEKIQRIKNEAVARRRMQREKRKEERQR